MESMYERHFIDFFPEHGIEKRGDEQALVGICGSPGRVISEQCYQIALA